MAIIQKFKSLYSSTYIQAKKVTVGSLTIIVDAGHYEPSLISRFFTVIFTFWLNHWKWIIGTVLALGAIIVPIIFGVIHSDTQK